MDAQQGPSPERRRQLRLSRPSVGGCRQRRRRAPSSSAPAASARRGLRHPRRAPGRRALLGPAGRPRGRLRPPGQPGRAVRRPGGVCAALGTAAALQRPQQPGPEARAARLRQVRHGRGTEGQDGQEDRQLPDERGLVRGAVILYDGALQG